MDWTDYYVKREQVKDYLRESDQDRLARKLRPLRRLPDIRCWASSRIYYVAALARHAWATLRDNSAQAQPRPALDDCR